jgi:hypothetical protein
MSSFTIYTIAVLIIVGALGFGASLLGVPAQWIAIGAAIALGVGIISAVSSTRKKDETEASQ